MASRTRELREKRGWTQVELADKAGIQQSTVSKLERRPGLGDRDTFARIAGALGVSADDIVQEDEPQSPHPSARPVMASLPNWDTVLERAKQLAPDVDGDSWALLEASPGLLSIDVPLTPAVVADLGRLVIANSLLTQRAFVVISALKGASETCERPPRSQRRDRPRWTKSRCTCAPCRARSSKNSTRWPLR